MRLVHSFCYRSVPVGLFSCNTKCKHKGMILFCGFISMTTQRERASERVGCQSHRVVGRWFAHLRIECETHVNVWVGVKRIEERVSMSQYENTLSVHLQEHLIRLAHQQTFFPPSFSPSSSHPPLFLNLSSLKLSLSLISNLKFFSMQTNFSGN